MLNQTPCHFPMQELVAAGARVDDVERTRAMSDSDGGWDDDDFEVPDLAQMRLRASASANAIEDKFADMWRSGPKNDIPSHVSWHERLKQLLSPEVQLREDMDVEGVYLLFAELLIQQSRSADPEYANRLLSLIEIKKDKRKRDYNWMD